MSADGATEGRLTTDAALDYDPAWSPDGTRIAFNRGGDIYLMNSNGSGQAPLAWVSDGCYISEGAEHPDWAPSGDRITFIRSYETDCSFELGPAQDVVTTRTDGSDFRVLGGFGFTPAYSPDGARIVYADSGAEGVQTLDATNPGGAQFVTSTSEVFAAPDWQPVPRGYRRPKGATPTRVPLVPAFKPCASPNSTHGAPLSYGSCAPPVPESGNAFVGIGDGDPALAKSIGSVRLRTLSNSSFDNADVGIDLAITNVMKTSDRSDYTGELRLELPLRITDRFNKPHPAGYGPGTVSDTSFFATVPCSPTTDTTLGSACTLSTTADTLLPAMVRGGARAIWALGQIRLQDGGPDGDAETPADNELLAVQGVFAP
jgi:hypothetical protein